MQQKNECKYIAFKYCRDFMLSSFLPIGLLEVKCAGSPSALVAHVPIHAPVTHADEKKK